ncbi:hypothetical protein PAPYR_2102 [Paratrimastix pyriformis]|uniref:Uncharacterized protein n=1 Tax=Paratrimastix pyriformis TaxID=342808 RepID=A0ABQ8UQS8_9EUKA|nr:hypothetical protein PAPYR_2102 [Paratrimastix pyriformis]
MDSLTTEHPSSERARLLEQIGLFPQPQRGRFERTLRDLFLKKPASDDDFRTQFIALRDEVAKASAARAPFLRYYTAIVKLLRLFLLLHFCSTFSLFTFPNWAARLTFLTPLGEAPLIAIYVGVSLLGIITGYFSLATLSPCGLVTYFVFSCITAILHAVATIGGFTQAGAFDTPALIAQAILYIVEFVLPMVTAGLLLALLCPNCRCANCPCSCRRGPRRTAPVPSASSSAASTTPATPASSSSRRRKAARGQSAGQEGGDGVQEGQGSPAIPPKSFTV